MSKPVTKRVLRAAAGASGLMLAFSLAACSPTTSDAPANGGSDSGTPEAGGSIDKVSILMRNDVDTFDPFTSAAEAGAKQFFDAAYDTLVRIEASETSADISGSMAESWELREDGGSFQLRSGLTCSDGTAIDAEGVAMSLRHLADPETGAPYASRVFGPDGLKEVVADNDANTIDIALNEPYTFLLEGLAQAYVVCPTAFDDIEALDTTPAETGTYALDSMSRGESYTLKSRETVTFDTSKQPQTLELRMVQDDTTRANLIETGAADIGSVLGRDAERLQDGHTQTDGLAYLADGLLFNQNEGLVGADLNVRKAISLAVDSASYTKAATFDLGRATDTMYTPNMVCYTESNGQKATGFDLEEAKKVLADAGYGENGETLKVRLLGIETQNSGPEYIADALRNAGIEVELNKGTFEQALGVLFGTGEWDIVVFPYPVPTPVPSTLVNQISGNPAESLNVGNVQNETYGSLVATAAQTFGDDQCGYWADAEAALLENVDVKPVLWSNAAWFSNDYSYSADFYKVDTRTIAAIAG